MRQILPCLVLTALISVGWSAQPAEQAFDQEIKPILSKFCYRCHNADKKESDLRLDALSSDLVNSSDGETWHDVLNKLNLGEMPPEEATQPSEAELAKVKQWITAELERASAVRRSTGGRVVLRRLNRDEYQNTMRDLFGLDLDYAKELPPESSSADGFKNNGQTLAMSPLQMEYYLQTARMALKKAIVTGDAPPVVKVTKTDSDKGKRVTVATGNNVGPGDRYLARLDEYPTEGKIHIKVRAKAVIPEGKPYPRMQVSLGLRSDTLAPETPLAEADVISTDDFQELDFYGRMENFPLPGHNPKYPGELITIRNISDQPKANVKKSKDKKKKSKDEPIVLDPNTSYITIESVTFEGPIFKTWPPETHQRILFPSKHSNDESDYAKEVIARFMQRAYRRPVEDSEVEVIHQFYQKARPISLTFEEAIQETLAMVLISPDFLYLMEPKANPKQQEKLTDYELATRISYFLWSTMPDVELNKLAQSGKLREKNTIESHLRKMTTDERSQEFVNHFASQWLNLSGVERIAVNPEFYPDFDDQLKVDMREETLAFFAHVLRNDLSALNFLDSDFTFVNYRLAKHYQINGPGGTTFEKVALSPEDKRGGLLTQGSILLSNSTGEESHPIKRAVWLLDRLLDNPPPPPPPDVPDLDPNEPNLAGLPLKQQLEVHRKKQACNSCHQGIDPWGIPFENYDAVGLWRTQYAPYKKKKNQPPVDVVVASKIPAAGDKVFEISGIDALKQHLLTHEKNRFAEALTKKMLAYALGRSLEFSDQDTVEELSKTFAKNDYRLSDLIFAIVQCDAFQNK